MKYHILQKVFLCTGQVGQIPATGRYALFGDQQGFPGGGRQRVRVPETARQRRDQPTDDYARTYQYADGRQQGQPECDIHEHRFDIG